MFTPKHRDSSDARDGTQCSSVPEDQGWSEGWQLTFTAESQKAEPDSKNQQVASKL